MRKNVSIDKIFIQQKMDFEFRDLKFNILCNVTFLIFFSL